MNTFTQLASTDLRRAVKIKAKIEKLEHTLERVLKSSGNGVAASRKPRNMSDAGRARIAAAQRARWAKFRSGRK